MIETNRDGSELASSADLEVYLSSVLTSAVCILKQIITTSDKCLIICE